ncbi:receptor-type tyrosine-protein phosphatase-like N isoform X2 [Tachyglossus aculeatus]|uniref:receptor-type tyrosine-protein phosphatase-like N isoform X2 n=1 Tax=Tachyglossus aculeatus TaxID=9261 RepID=UPI0018F28A53|nr:receptor-type tyrosine-protein phosphatase-like N isoform X2 [Tachyglossus aculeatus]
MGRLRPPLRPLRPLRALLGLLFLLAGHLRGSGAARAHGCLFDHRLCSRQEICIQDGLFGRCQVGPGGSQSILRVTSPILQRLQDVLRHLMAQGLSWQDDVTQLVISQEMERIPRLPPPDPDSRDRSAASRKPAAARGSPGPAGGTAGVFPPLLENLLMSPKSGIPALGYQAALLQPYLFHQFGGPPKAEPPPLFSRASSKALLGAYPGPMYRTPPEPDLGLPPLPGPRGRDGGKSWQSLPGGGPGEQGKTPAQNLPPSGRPSGVSEDAAGGESQKGMEGEMQHGDPRTISDPTAPRPNPPGPAPSASPVPTDPPAEPPLPPKSPPPGRSGPRTPQPPAPAPRLVEEYGYIVTDQTPLGLAAGVRLLELLAAHVHLSSGNFINISVVGPAVTFRVRHNEQNLSLAEVTQQAGLVKSELEAEAGFQIMQTGVGQREEPSAVASEASALALALARPAGPAPGPRWVALTLVGIAGAAGLVAALAVALAQRRHGRGRRKDGLAGLGPEGAAAAADTTFEYQELCRQHMATKSLFSRGAAGPEGPPGETSRVSSVSSQFSDAAQPSPSSHSSTPSWGEEPAPANMDISTGHMILAYMEDHLKNRGRLAQEWQALCGYQAEPNSCKVAQGTANLKKNRLPDSVPYDHVRVKLKVENSPTRSDYINASPIIEHDPRMPAYIATQGPLSHTIADFWQMVWENGCTVIVMLTPLVEDGVKQCDRYWPDEGSSLYHIYEVNLVSEHIWCEDFLVRSFYLKNVQSQESRTLTQFHFLSWPVHGTPASTRPLLDFRRKVNKCYRGRSCPVIVHCSDGAGRAGTYILIDMVLNRMAKGVKEIDIAATLEHIRDQRPGLVRTKDQFEFALTAVAEEVNAILKALPQ